MKMFSLRRPLFSKNVFISELKHTSLRFKDLIDLQFPQVRQIYHLFKHPVPSCSAWPTVAVFNEAVLFIVVVVNVLLYF